MSSTAYRSLAGALSLAAAAALAANACSSDDAVTSNAAGSTTGSGSGGGATSGTGSTATGSTTTTSTSTSSGTSGSTGTATSSSGSGGAGGGGPVVRYAAFGDSGKGNQGQLDVAAAVAAKCAADGCDFVQLLGDNIYDSGVTSVDDPQWQTKFEQPYAGVDLPFWVVLGNHDYGGNGAGTEPGKGQFEVDYTAVSTKWKLPSAYYQRTDQHVAFFGLDTNPAMFYLAGQQQTDVTGWIASSPSTWKIAFGHHPYLSNGPHGNAGSYDGVPFLGGGVKDLLDAAVCGAADVYISGHDHRRQWLVDTCGGSTELIVSGGGAAVTDLGGSNPAHFEAATLGFLYVRIDGNTFTGEFIDTAGNVEFTRTLTK